MKILCFTTTYNRPYYIYNTINNILNQSYKDITYSININYKSDDQKKHYIELLQDFNDDTRLKISYHTQQSQHKNYLNAIKSGDDNHDLFIKIDDDDIYHKNYLEKGIKIYQENNSDILSFISTKHINYNYCYGEMKEIGHWPGDNHPTKFGMPSTYFFNRKALDLILKLNDIDVKKIHIWEDPAWRKIWREHNLSSTVITESNMMTYHIHEKNTSSTFLLKDNPDTVDYNGISTPYCDIVYFKHPHWQSFMILNKRNNRIYNIKNDDHGKYKIIPDDTIIVTWDKHNSEKFQKSKTDNSYSQIK